MSKQTEAEPGVVTNKLRPDMFVDPETFELTIGQVQIQDDGQLACKTVGRGGQEEYYDFRQIAVYGKFNFLYKICTGLVQLLHRWSSIQILPDYWVTFCAGVLPMSIFDIASVGILTICLYSFNIKWIILLDPISC